METLLFNLDQFNISIELQCGRGIQSRVKAMYPASMTPSKLLVRTALSLCLLLPAALPAQESPAQPFDQWLEELRAEALASGIRAQTLDQALSAVDGPIARVVELDRSQPEFSQTFGGYMRNRISDRRVQRGRELLQEHAELFARIEREYGVQPHYLVSFWALESNFGAETGGF